MKVLSLFDGMACGALALQSAGIEIESYDAFETDEYAIKSSTHNFPFIIHHGDVFKGDFTKFRGVDLLCGGSPCTYWSIAQRNNRETEASGLGWELFCQYVRALKEAEPKYFVYENNKSMSKAIRQSIDETFGFEAVLINSALVSAQNRQRLYWVGKRNEDGTYTKVDVEQPIDRGILLKDILDSGEDLTSNDKAYTLTASYNGAVPWNTIERCQRNMVIEPINVTSDGKAHTIKAQYYKNGIANFITNGGFGATAVATPIKVGCYPSPDGTLKNSQGMRIYSVEGKAVNQVAQGGGMGAKTGLYAIPSDKTSHSVYEVKNGYITIRDKSYPIKLADGWYTIRKLNITECKRLQTVPEWYEFPVSNSQAYKLLGNGWTVEVIAHILRSLK